MAKEEFLYVCVGRRELRSGKLATFFVRADVADQDPFPTGSSLALSKGRYACGGNYVLTLEGESVYTKGALGPDYKGVYSNKNLVAQWRAEEIAADGSVASSKAEALFRKQGFDVLLRPITEALRRTNHAGRAAILVEVMRTLNKYI